jgi:outer membrane receptor protein involved in Fe transport
MIKKIFITSFILFSIFSFSQDKKVNGYSGATKYNSNKKTFKGTVSGKIIDETTKENLAYTNVSLTNLKTNKIVEGTVTEERGKFNFNDVVTGKYKISISFIGYTTKELEFELTGSKPDYNFKRILLTPSSNKIAEIEINEEKAIYENKIDKIVYNPENDINQSADDATDVLRKAPLLSVDLDGNVSLRGSKNIKFLINGKTSAFFSSDAATALQMIPADQIKSVEVITSPGAKYDGEGDAGIVNIITKKKIIDGYKGTISGSFGTRVNRQSLNLMLGKGRFGLSAKGGAHYSWPRIGITDYERKDWDALEDTNTLLRNGETYSQWIGYRGGIDMFYDLNAFQSITSSLSFSGRDKFNDDSTQIKYTGIDTSYNYKSILNSTSVTNQVEWSSDFTKKFANNEDREFSMALQISGEFEDEETKINENNSLITNLNDGIGIEKTFQIDYTHPFGRTKKKYEGGGSGEKMQKKSESRGMHGGKGGSSGSSSATNKIEIGAKLIDRDKNFVYSTIDSIFNDNILNSINNITPEETFNYNQKVGSAYLSSQFKLPRDFGLILGGRYEFTKINGNWDNNSYIPFENSYGNFLPNVVINKKISETNSIKLSFNRRITRPSSYYINPNIGRTDNKNIIIGNPELNPSLSNQLEFGYTSFSKIYQGSYFVYLKRTTDVIESNISVQGDISTTSYLNIGENTKLGLNYYGSIMLGGVNLRGGFNVFEYSSEDTRFGNIRAILYNYNIGGTVDLGNRFKFETWGWFSSPTQTLQGTTDNFSMMSFGIKKDFKNKRGSLGIRLIEPFSKYKDFTTELEGSNFTQYSNRQLTFRSIGISFKYTFGKLNFKSKSMNSKINNNDLKEGGDNEQ